MAFDIWSGGKAAWSDAGDWSLGEPFSGSNVEIGSGDVEASGAIGSVDSLSLTKTTATLDLETAGGARASLSVLGALANSGDLLVDVSGDDGGSSLTVDGELINKGRVQIGDEALTLGLNDTLSVGSLDNIGGEIDLYGCLYHMNMPAEATLDVGGAAGFGAAGVVEGDVNLNCYSEIVFASGQITSIAAGAKLTIDGYKVFIADSSDTSENSALTGLRTNSGNFSLDDGAWVNVAGELTNTGAMAIDTMPNIGGSRLAIGGALTNSGVISIGSAGLVMPSWEPGPAAAIVAAASLTNRIGSRYGTLDLVGDSNGAAGLEISGAAGFGAAGTLFGSVNLSDDALIEFASGEINAIAIRSELTLVGAHALVADDDNLTASSALFALASIAGTLNLEDGASVLAYYNVSNQGLVELDRQDKAGGSVFKDDGRLTNTGTMIVGSANSTLSAASAIDAGSLGNSGVIDLIGGGGHSASLNVSGGIVNHGVINVTDDYEKLAGAVSGNLGRFNLSAGSTLEFGAGVAVYQTVMEHGSGETLILDDASDFHATIGGLVSGDIIDLSNFAFAGAADVLRKTNAGAGVLTIGDASKTIALNIAGSGLATSDFQLSSYDGGAGVQIKFI